MKALGLCLASLSTLAYATAHAVPAVECPAVIQPDAIKVEMQGWVPYIEFPLYLTSASIAAGPPEMRAVLRGEQISKRGQPEVTLFRFGETGFEQGKWLECSYGHGGAISLHKRLHDNLKECTVTFRTPQHAKRQVIKIDCE
jgi:hypothetical protein